MEKNKVKRITRSITITYYDEKLIPVLADIVSQVLFHNIPYNNLNVSVSWEYKKYTIRIEGEEEKVENLVDNLIDILYEKLKSLIKQNLADIGVE